ncbi:MAG: hypothetical protein H0X30_15145 [Anaerolineae bacterium]|nr:hypothetical protein [Anaerolineae bacterium]
MELDKRVGDYAVAIVRDADLLVKDAANLNEEQQQFAVELKGYAVRFLSLFKESMQHFERLTGDARIAFHDLRTPFNNIAGYCELLLSDRFGSVNPSQLLLQIKAAHDFIKNTFTTWLNAGQTQIKEFDTRLVTYANSIVIYAGALVAEKTTLNQEQQKYVHSITKAIQHLIQIHTQDASKRKLLEDLDGVNDKSVTLSTVIMMRQAILVALSNNDLLKSVGDRGSWSNREGNNFNQMEAFLFLIRDELTQAFKTLSSA